VFNGIGTSEERRGGPLSVLNIGGSDGRASASVSCDTYGLDWLTKVFDKHTREKAGRGRRLLIVDGYLLHVNMAFLN
jgi:hypothetical protein